LENGMNGSLVGRSVLTGCFVIILGGCENSALPTEHVHRPAIVLPVVIVEGGSECSDPNYERDEWGMCRPREKSGGGGSSSGNGGDPGGGSGSADGGADAEPSPTNEGNDDVAHDPPPDCSQPQTDARGRACCRATVPEGDRREKTNAALSRIENRGPACALIAQEGCRLLSQGRLRYFV
jgi:hypothetical protein